MSLPPQPRAGSVYFIGIDPGLASTGYGIVEGDGRSAAILEYGCIRTRSDETTPRRLLTIYRVLEALILKWKPAGMAVEDVFSAPRMPGAALTLGEVRGVIQLSAAAADISVLQLPARQVKQALTGSGAADKDQLERALRDLTGWEAAIRPSHASDALAIAVVGLSRWKSRAPRASGAR